MITFLDGLVAVFLCWWGYIGFKRGFIEELSRLFGIVFAFVLAKSYTEPFVLWLRKLLPMDNGILIMVGSATLFTVALLCVRFFTQFLHQFIITRLSRMVDRILGIVFGIAKGGILVMLIVWGLGISPLKEWADIMKKSSGLISAISGFGDRSFSALGIDGSLSDFQGIFPVIENGPQDK